MRPLADCTTGVLLRMTNTIAMAVKANTAITTPTIEEAGVCFSSSGSVNNSVSMKESIRG